MKLALANDVDCFKFTHGKLINIQHAGIIRWFYRALQH